MLARITTSSIAGIEAIPVEVEVEVREGPQRFLIVGMADNAVKEAKERVTAALSRIGMRLPEQVLVNLSPAAMKKEGSHFDLPIALGVLRAAGMVPASQLSECSFHGELGLDGTVKPVLGTAIRAIDAFQRGMRSIVLPAENANEASLVKDLQVFAVRSLREAVEFCQGKPSGPLRYELQSEPVACVPPLRLSDVRGQESAKRALVVAAAGGHHLLMVGPPGCGKSMLAVRLPLLLPPLQNQEMLEAVKIHSLAALNIAPLLAGLRPVRAPHYGISTHALIGGGAVPRPGEISLAHHGVLFLDEFPEFSRSAIESLRIPLESQQVSVARVRQSVTFPADFQLIAAMNPCPCGRLGVLGGESCLCSRVSVQSYLSKLSRPILDRIDLQVSLNPVTFEELHGVKGNDADDTYLFAQRVTLARALQMERQGCRNAALTGDQLNACVQLDSSAQSLLARAMERLGLSARGSIRVLRVARTIADLAGGCRVSVDHIAEALSYRALSAIAHYVTPSSSGFMTSNSR